MKKFTIVKLNFTSPLHLHHAKGDYETTDTVLHSDTITSALASVLNMLYTDFDTKNYMEKLIVSSAFPFIDKVFFFPKPMIKLPVKIDGFDENTSSKEAKILKKLEFIDKDYFEKIINHAHEEVIHIGKSAFKYGNKYLSDHTFEKPFVKEVQTRVKVDFDEEGSLPYDVERIFFNENAGLYFFIAPDDKETLDFTKIALNYLGEEGFGTDKSVGNGQFVFDIESLDLNIPESDFSMILSLYCPEKDEISNGILEDSSYSLTKRGGYIAGALYPKFRHLKRKPVYMMTEASVLNTANPRGKIVNVRPEWQDELLHNVYRSGKAFSIPINSN